ncbi:hypothetical protein CA265_03275 [Sphingobacteriaceae bacterium GW460-11-11-14-LB5]|nr:hypothetical protein CA265_03275 [Sphingobacteriaceae bacterium GW460-11-11-14-LB5]
MVMFGKATRLSRQKLQVYLFELKLQGLDLQLLIKIILVFSSDFYILFFSFRAFASSAKTLQ